MKKKKRKKAGSESSKESSLRDWFKRKGAKGKVDGLIAMLLMAKVVINHVVVRLVKTKEVPSM